MVDSFGGILPNEVKEIIKLVQSKTKVPLGFHGHDNLSMGLINSITAMQEGCEIIDSTITGMGRGAGNLRTELLLTYLESQLRNKTTEFKKSISDQTLDINRSINDINIKISNESSNTEKELLFKQVESLENDLILKKAEILDELLPEAFAVVKETAKRFFDNEEIEVVASDFDKEIAAKKSYTKIKNDKCIWKNTSL